MIKISSNFEETLRERFAKYFRFDNSLYWQDYYQQKYVKGDTRREEEYAKIIKKYAKNGKIVDIGSGFGFLLREMWRQGLKVEGVDLFEEMINEGRKYLHDTDVKIIKSDILEVPYTKDSLDGICLMSILEHFPEQEVREDIVPFIRKLLKKRGIVFVHVPMKTVHSRFARWYRKFIDKDLPIWALDDDGDVTHRMWLTSGEYIKMFEEYGFELINYDFYLTRSNLKPKILSNFMGKLQQRMKYTDPVFEKCFAKEPMMIKLSKMFKAHMALTGYLLFRKI